MTQKIQEHRIQVSGNDTVTSDIAKGKILAVGVEFSAGSAAGTDTTLKTVGNSSPQQTILNLTDVNTSQSYYPRDYAQDTAGSDLTYDGTNKIPAKITVSDYLKATVAQNNSDDTVTLTVLVETY